MPRSKLWRKKARSHMLIRCACGVGSSLCDLSAGYALQHGCTHNALTRAHKRKHVRRKTAP
eukprot:8268390-Alexandrium_andersonii.AAC.1